MLASMAALHKFNFSVRTSKFTSKTLFLKPLEFHIHSFLPKSHVLQIHLPASLKMVESHSKLKLSVSAAAPILSEEETPMNKEKLGVVVKPMEKPRVVLKLIRMQKDVGVGLDQVVPGFGTIPLTPYYFWRKEDAKEQLKLLLERKPWISHKQMHILLNQATHIFNLWPESG